MGLLRDLFTTGRLHGSGNLIGPFIAVAILVRMPWTLWPLLGLAGSLCYVAGCAHNSVVDRFRDAKDPLRTQLPLVVGRVSPRQVLAFAVVTELIAAGIIIGVSWFRHPGSFLVPALIGVSALLSYLYNEYGKTSSRSVAAVLFAFATTIPILAVGVAWTGVMTPVLWWLGAAWTLGLLYVTVSGDWKDLDSAVKQGERNLVTDCGGTLTGGRVFWPGRYGILLGANGFACVLVDWFFAHWLNGWIWGALVGTIAAAAYLWNYREIMRPTWEKSRATYVAALGTVFSIVGPFFVLTWAIGWYWMPVLIFGPILLHLGLLKVGVGKEWSNSILSNRRMVRR